MPTTYEDLVPQTVAAEIVATVSDDESALMQLARTIPMPSGVETIPVVTASPASGFVSPAYGGLKPGGTVDFAPARLWPGSPGTRTRR